jgi:peptidoglycan lytic transglycosylase D
MRVFHRVLTGSVTMLAFFVTGCLPLTPQPGPPEPAGQATEFDTSSVKPDVYATPVQQDSVVENGPALSSRELIEEALKMVNEGAKQYLRGNRVDALTNLDAAMLNLQLVDLPNGMRQIEFFQPYLSESVRTVDLRVIFAELKQTEQPDDVVISEPETFPEKPFTGTDEQFIESEILRIMEHLGAEPPKPEDLTVFNREVEHFIRYYQDKRRDWFERSYYRMLKYQGTVDRIFTEKRLPSELNYLAFIESGYLYRATSRAKARGIWQFIRSTGRHYGLSIGTHKDERLDPIKSTVAAREYLLDLISIFGSRSFLLAMASYNAGEGKVQRCLRTLDDPFENRSFWKIRSCLRRETREYIPRIIAAAIICETPERFGFKFLSLSEYMERYDLVICPRRVKYSSVSKAAGISVSTLRELNPDLPSGGSWTPVNNTHLWIPTGTGAKVTAALSKMSSPSPPKTEGDYHIVRKGDNLYMIGRRYKIPYKKLASWNNIRYPYKIKPGQKVRLYPPGSPPSTVASKSTASRCDETLVYIVQKGNYLAGISALFGTTARSIMATNNLTRGTIFPGQRLRICPGFPVEIIQHIVSKNETLGKIAKRYHIRVDQIRFVNGIRKNSVLRVGQKLTIYRKASG